MVDVKARVRKHTRRPVSQTRQSKPKSILFFLSKKLIYCNVSTHNMEPFLHKPINHVDALE